MGIWIAREMLPLFLELHLFQEMPELHSPQCPGGTRLLLPRHFMEVIVQRARLEVVILESGK